MQISGLRSLDGDFPKILTPNYEHHICLIFFREVGILKIAPAWQRHEKRSMSFVDAIESSADRGFGRPLHQVFHNYYYNEMRPWRNHIISMILHYLLTRICHRPAFCPHPVHTPPLFPHHAICHLGSENPPNLKCQLLIAMTRL